MNFTLSDDQRMLQDTVERLVARDYGFEQRKAYAREPKGYSAAVWARYAELFRYSSTRKVFHGLKLQG